MREWKGQNWERLCAIIESMAAAEESERATGRKINFKTHGPKEGMEMRKCKKIETIGKCFDMFFRSGSGRKWKCGNIKHRDVCEILCSKKRRGIERTSRGER